MRDRPASPFALMSVLAALLLSSMRVTAADSRLYDSRCSLCHQGKAVGVPGQFPRLAGRVREIASRPEGRRYLLHVVLFGLAGKIEIDSMITQEFRLEDINAAFDAMRRGEGIRSVVVY